MIDFNEKFTPIAPDYASCDKCYVVLSVLLKNICMEVVNEFDSFSKTDGGKNLFLSSEYMIASKDLREHIDWLMQKISSLNINLIGLKNTYDIKYELKCFWKSAHGHGGPTLYPKHMKIISDIEADFVFDIYYE
jgi:hypothetical protein